MKVFVSLLTFKLVICQLAAQGHRNKDSYQWGDSPMKLDPQQGAYLYPCQKASHIEISLWLLKCCGVSNPYVLFPIHVNVQHLQLFPYNINNMLANKE